MAKRNIDNNRIRVLSESPKEQLARNGRRSRRASKLIQRHASTLCKVNDMVPRDLAHDKREVE